MKTKLLFVPVTRLELDQCDLLKSLGKHTISQYLATTKGNEHMVRFGKPNFCLFLLLLFLVGITVHDQENDQRPNLITGWEGTLQVLLWRP